LRNVGASALNFEETTLKNKVLCKIQINVFNIKPSYSSNNPRITNWREIPELQFYTIIDRGGENEHFPATEGVEDDYRSEKEMLLRI
jgi:hypothetical protein